MRDSGFILKKSSLSNMAVTAPATTISREKRNSRDRDLLRMICLNTACAHRIIKMISRARPRKPVATKTRR